MTQPPPSPGPERIDLRSADDPRDVVHRVVASLAQGGAVLVAAGDHCGIAVGALQPGAAQRVDRYFGGNGAAGAFTLLLKGSDELADWVDDRPRFAARLARRAWPGRITLAFNAPRASGLLGHLPAPVVGSLLRENQLAFHVPSHPFLRDVLRLTPGPILYQELAPGWQSAGRTLEELPARCGANLLIDPGPGGVPDEATVVRVDEGGWSVQREGLLDEVSLRRLASTILLFVCTGNTCRSPMAEALCKVLLAERLGCEVEDLEANGFVVLSAGIAAISGMPAAANAIDVVKSRGGSLAGHQSRRLSVDLVRHADLILGMTGDHLEALVENVPEAAARTRLLHPEGRDVADPVGADRATYLRTAESIEAYLKALLDTIDL